MFAPLFCPGLRPVLLAVTLSLLSIAVSAERGENGSVSASRASAEARMAEKKIGDSLGPSLSSSQLVPVIVVLSDQPAFQIADDVQAAYDARLRANEEEIKAIHRVYTNDRRPANALDAARMAREQAAAMTVRDRQRITEINQRSQAIKQDMRREIERRTKLAVERDQETLRGSIASLGGSLTYAYEIGNMLSARVPGNAIQALANHPLVLMVEEDRRMPAHLNVSAPAIRAETFWNAGETGGVWWNATCDTGVDTSHPALSGKTWWQGVFHSTAAGDSSYNDNSSSTDDLQGHGTHVAGIANSQNATNRGISHGSTRSTNLKAGWRSNDGGGWMYWSDSMASVHWGFSNATMDVINLSFGGEMTVDDSGFIRFWDAVVDARSTTATISAGNSGAGTNKLGEPSLSWNALCVANVDDRGTVDRADDIITASSSRGPTPGGRKKPDVSAPGRLIMAPAHNWEGANADYVEKTGTSMAAPHVAGAATLLHDVGISDPRAVKAVLINTADFIQGQTTWNATYGWGYINLDNAYLRRTNWFLHDVTPRNTPGWYKLYKVPSPVVGDKATMVWNRHVNYNNASDPTIYYNLNDLNLRFYRESNNAWVAESLSDMDNVEQIVSTTTAPLVIRAYSWSTGFSHPGSTERYALAVPPGTVAATGPVLSANAAAASYSPPLNAKFLVRVRASNSAGDLAAHNCTLTVALPAGVTLISGSLSNSLGTIDAGSSSGYLDLWLKATTSGTKTVNLSVSSNSYGIDDWSGSGSFTVNPGAADTTAPYTAMRIGGPTYQTSGTDKLANGGFESDLAGWATSGTVGIETDSAYAGSKYLRLGPGTGEAYQTVTISAASSRAILSFWYKSSASLFVSCACQIQDSSGNILVTPFSTTSSQSTWTRAVMDVSRFRGQTVRVSFRSYSSLGFNSTLLVDAVGLKENEIVWVDSTSALTLIARDDNSGLDYTQYALNGGAWTTYSAPFTLAGQDPGYNYLYYRSIDNGANFESSVTAALWLDDEPPLSVLSIGSPRVVVGGTARATNGGFESGLTGWNTSGSVSLVSSPVRSGLWAARIGLSGAGSVYQDVPIPSSANRAFASVWFRFSSGVGASYPSVSIKDPVTGLSCWALAYAGTITDWTQLVWDVTRFKGSTVRLEFAVSAPSGTTPAVMYVDDVQVWQDANAYVRPTSVMAINSAERVGVEAYQYNLDSAGYVEGTTFQLTGTGLHTIAYRALDRLGHLETGIQTQINTDDTGPTGTVTINGGAAQTASRNVILSLSAADPVGVTEMRIQSDSGTWGSWQAYQTTLNYTMVITTSGTRTIGVQYRDTLGNTSPTYTDTIEYVQPVLKDIPGVKMVPNDSAVVVTRKVVTAVFPAQGYFYISEPDRVAGVRVRSTAASPAIGTSVEVMGFTRIVFAEREIVADEIIELGAATAIKPLAMANARLGGSAFHYQPGISGSSGLNNIGQLVITWGRVTKVIGSNYYIDDGSSVKDSYPTLGILVRGGDVGLTPPRVGQYLEVTAISGASTLSGIPIRVLRPRYAADVRLRHFEAAFVYGSNANDAMQFKNLLDSQGARTDIVKYSAIGTTDWSKYHVILIGNDTGGWAEPAIVSTILGANTPVVGIGEGGARFMDAVTTPNLFIGWGQSAIALVADGAVFGGDIYSTPHNLSVTTGDVLGVFGSSVYTVMLYDPNGTSQRMLRLPSSSGYFPVAGEAGRFYQWGYSASPLSMTQVGKNLFTNLVFEAVRP